MHVTPSAITAKALTSHGGQDLCRVVTSHYRQAKAACTAAPARLSSEPGVQT